MDMKELYPFALLLLLVSMVIGAGVLAVDKFGIVSRTAATQNDYNFSATNLSCVSVGQSFVSTTSATFENKSGGANPENSCFTWDATGTYAGTCVRLANTVACMAFNNSEVNATYTYGATSAATTALIAGRGEISGISTSWLGLVVTIGILSIIIVLIMRGFGKNR